MLKKEKFLKFKILQKIERCLSDLHLKKLSIFRILKIFTFYIRKASKCSKTYIKQVYRAKMTKKEKKINFFKTANFLKFRIFCFFRLKSFETVVN